ncbi:uroporphyrinogen-III synthase [Phenylobacterium sp.]|uniref:uroporphyrinogen-III synthase n=1 Tax=Phenylobacterium sp. TaxID=1871053 RepID=UPI002FDA1FC8
MTASPRPLVWITRAEPGASATAERVRTLGALPLVAPLLEVRALETPLPDLSEFAALAFTSANGVRALAGRTPARGLPVFAVGAATARTAREAGFRQVLSADGDVAALAQGMAARARDLRGPILHPTTTEPAGDLAADLAAHGLVIQAVPLYETVPAQVPKALLARALEAQAVLLHSPKAARRLAVLLRGRGAPDMAALCLSRAVGRPLARARLGPRLYAPMPMESALLNLIARLPAEAGPVAAASPVAP